MNKKKNLIIIKFRESLSNNNHTKSLEIIRTLVSLRPPILLLLLICLIQAI